MKNALNWIIILILTFGSIPNSSAQFGMMDTPTKYEYSEKYQMVIDYYNTTKFIEFMEEYVEESKKNNVDTKTIESMIANSRKELNKNNYNEAFQLAVKAYEMARTAILSNYINIVNSEINNATSIGADTKPAVAKLEEAKRVLSKGDYNNASLFASDAYILALTSNMGFVSIKDLISSKINVPESKYNGHTVETGGLIRNIKTSGASYNFVIDDGNGVISVAYSGGLGDIKEGESVYVKGVYNSQNINAESVSKGSGLVGGISSNVKAPGFEAILAISIIGALRLRRKL